MKKSMLEVAKEIALDLFEAGIISKNQVGEYEAAWQEKVYGKKSVFRANKEKKRPSSKPSNKEIIDWRIGTVAKGIVPVNPKRFKRK